MTLDQLVMLGISLLMLISFAMVAIRSRRRARLWDDYDQPNTGRTTPSSNLRWRGDNNATWGTALEEAEAEFKELKKAADERVPDLPSGKSKNFSGIPLEERKVAAMNYLNKLRGQKITLITVNFYRLSGKIVTLTGQQVMLRMDDGEVKGVLLHEIDSILV